MNELLPLFPLDTVLFPRMVLPLHIFEERYKEMIGHCLHAKTTFGVLDAHDRTTERIGCRARILKVFKKYEDGRMDLLTRGQERFEILHFDTDASYPRGWSVPYPDTDPAPTPGRDEVDQLLELYREIFSLLYKKAADPVTIAPGYEGVSFQIAANSTLAKTVRQQVLEGRSEKERIALLTTHFKERLARLRLTEAATERAGSNGHVR